MKLIHIADVHLDAKMETGLTAARARERRAELLATFCRAVETGESQGARAVLIAGDLFDTARVSESTRRSVGDVICEHPSMHFFYVAGNHDAPVPPLFPGDNPPSNWTAFDGQGWESVVMDGVRISATPAMDRPGIYDELPTAAPDEFHIVMLHGQIVRSGAGGGERIPLRALQGRGIDYLALGHEHTHRCEPLDKRGLWAYAGCLEGRGFDECGPKGYVLLDTDVTGDARVSFYPAAKRTLHLAEVDVSVCETAGEIKAAMQEAVADIARDDMVKVVLTGGISPDLTYDTVYLSELLSDRFYFSRLADETRLAIRPEDYAADVSLKGEFIRTVMSSRLSEEQKRRTILAGLRALCGEEVDV